jgi:hypothetical protein
LSVISEIFPIFLSGMSIELSVCERTEVFPIPVTYSDRGYILVWMNEDVYIYMYDLLYIYMPLINSSLSVGKYSIYCREGFRVDKGRRRDEEMNSPWDPMYIWGVKYIICFVVCFYYLYITGYVWRMIISRLYQDYIKIISRL